MSEKEIVDQALKEFGEDPGSNWIIGNVVFDIAEPESFEYLMDKFRPLDKNIYDTVGPENIETIITSWIYNGGDVKSNELEELADWVEKNLDSEAEHAPEKTYICMRVATLFAPDANVYSDDEEENRRFANQDLMKK